MISALSYFVIKHNGHRNPYKQHPMALNHTPSSPVVPPVSHKTPLGAGILNPLGDNGLYTHPTVAGSIDPIHIARLAYADDDTYDDAVTFDDPISSYADDTDASTVASTVLDTMAKGSDSPHVMRHQVKHIVPEIHSHLQDGGPLDELLKERKSGKITEDVFDEKLVNYIQHMAAKHDIPMHRRGSRYKGMPRRKLPIHPGGIQRRTRRGGGTFTTGDEDDIDLHMGPAGGLPGFRRVRRGGKWTKPYHIPSWGLGNWSPEARAHRMAYDKELYNFANSLDEEAIL